MDPAEEHTLRIHPLPVVRGFALEWELDLPAEGQLRQTLLGQLEPRRDMVLDLSGLRFVDSTGLRVLADVSRSLDRGRRP